MNRPQTPPSSSTSPQSHARSRAKKLTKEQRIEVRIMSKDSLITRRL
ncbi:hypothetical protein K3495_g15176 [Podosphaera aphanis]|nr:hypothetical protein K3495_g15176 [Podosphaera aphanis]